MPKKRKVGRPARGSRVIYLSLDPTIAEMITRDADQDCRTISGQIEQILKKHYGEAAAVTA